MAISPPPDESAHGAAWQLLRARGGVDPLRRARGSNGNAPLGRGGAFRCTHDLTQDRVQDASDQPAVSAINLSLLSITLDWDVPLGNQKMKRSYTIFM